MENQKYTLHELKILPTIVEGHFSDLKIVTEIERVWLSRCTVNDGEPYNNKVTVEHFIRGCWVEVAQYPAVEKTLRIDEALKEVFESELFKGSEE